jgi:AmmeMemoRadiSam system protein B
MRLIEDSYRHPVGPGGLPGKAQQAASGPLGLVCPHAGFIYSGPVAAHSYRSLADCRRPERAVVLGPNHYGLGSSLVSPAPHDFWETPLGRVPIDREFVGKFLARCRPAQEDELPHVQEHSIEVQVPYLQHLYGDAVPLVPICMAAQDLETSQEVGHALADLVRGTSTVLIASTDFTHYEPLAVAYAQDKHALTAIAALDAVALAEAIRRHNITMCGPGPVMVLLTACRDLGATKARILRYATSGDTAGDASRVVGYGAAVVERPAA